MINEVACIPSVLSNSEVSNISEMSMKMLFHLAGIKANTNIKWMSLGLQERFQKWERILALQGINIDGSVDIIFNLSMPIDGDELYSNLEKMKNMGAISARTIMEQSEYIKDADVEFNRIVGEGQSENEQNE